MPKKTISITEGRKNLFKIAEEVQRPNTYYSFTVDGSPQVVLMSQDEFDSIISTMDILNDRSLLEELNNIEKKIDKGEYYTLDQIKEEFGFTSKDLILRESPKKKYKVKSRKGKSKKKNAG